MTDVFISYSRRDKAFVTRLVEAISTQDRQRKVWVDWEGIPPTADWLAEIYEAIESADNFMFIISHNSLLSEVCNREVAYAFEHGKQIVPVIYRDIVEKELVSEWYGHDWESLARENWRKLKHLNWIFFRVDYSDEEIKAFRSQHPDDPTARLPEESFDEALQVVLETVDLDLEHKRFHTRLTVKAEEWDRSGRSTDYVLRGEELTNAQQWLTTSENKQPAPTQLQIQYIVNSSAWQQEQENKHREQQQREMHLAQNLLEQERKAKQRRNYLVVVLTLSLIVVVGLLFYAINRRQAADRAQSRAEISRDEALISESHVLSTLAERQLVVDPVTSIGLGIAALPDQSESPRPYVARAELILAKALQTSLERVYLQTGISDSDQIDFKKSTGTITIAVGGDSVRILRPDLTSIMPSDTTEAQAVSWSDTGELLSYTGNTLQVWHPNGAQYHRLELETEGIDQAVWRPKTLLIAVRDQHTVWLWDAETEQLDDPIVGPSEDFTIEGMRWSPDGRWLAMWTYHPEQFKSSLLIWDQKNARFERSDDSYADIRITDLIWSPDDQHFLVLAVNLSSSDDDVPPQIERIDDAALSIPLRGHTDDVKGAEFITLDDEPHVMTWGYDLTARLWTLEGDLVQTFDHGRYQEGTLRSVNGVVFSADKSRVLIYLDNGLAIIWDIGSGTAAKTLRGHTAEILSASWEGDYIVTTSADNTARLWKVDDDGEFFAEALITLYGHTDRVLGAMWLDDQRLLTYSGDGSLRIWHVLDDAGAVCYGRDDDGIPECRGRSQGFVEHHAGIVSARWLNDATILTTSDDGLPWRWSVDTGDYEELPSEISVQDRSIWNPSGTHILTYTIGGGGEVWDVETDTRAMMIDGPISQAIWLNVGLLITREDSQTQLVDITSGQITDLAISANVVDYAQADIDGRYLATVAGGVGRIWDPETGDLVFELNQSTDKLSTLAWNNTGNWLLSVAQNGVLTLWDTQKQPMQSVWTFDTETDHTRALAAFDAMNNYIAVAFPELTVSKILVLNIDTLQPGWYQTSADNRPLFRGIQWNPTGTRLLIWGEDREKYRGFASLLDAQTVEEVLTLRDPGAIRAASFNSDATQILTAGDSKRLVVWHVSTSTDALLTEAQACCLTRTFMIDDFLQ